MKFHRISVVAAATTAVLAILTNANDEGHNDIDQELEDSLDFTHEPQSIPEAVLESLEVSSIVDFSGGSSTLESSPSSSSVLDSTDGSGSSTLESSPDSIGGYTSGPSLSTSDVSVSVSGEEEQEADHQIILEVGDTNEQKQKSSLLYSRALEILEPLLPPSSSLSTPSSPKSSHTILTSSNIPQPLRARLGPAQIKRFLSQKLQWPRGKLIEKLFDLLGRTNRLKSILYYFLKINEDQQQYQRNQKQLILLREKEDILSTRNAKNRENILNQAIDLLTESSKLGSDDALYLLAEMHFFGNYTCPRDFLKSLHYYEQLASHGNASAQFMTGLAYSTGLFGTLPVDQAKASLYYTFAAHGGDVRAKMAMGFRYLAAIGGPPNYEAAYAFYRGAADKSLEYYLNGPDPFIRKHLGHNSIIIPDEFYGGIYGQGASDVSSGSGDSSRGGFGSSSRNGKQLYGLGSIEGVLEFDEFVADESVIVQFALAVLFYEGGIYSEPDYQRSIIHALRGAGQVWDSSTGQMRSAVTSKLDKETIYFASRCAGFIGQRYLKGEGFEQNFTKALEWFQRGVQYDDPNSHNGLGMMYLHGVELPRDVDKAYEHLKIASDRKMSSAQLNLAKIFRAKGDQSREFEYITLAAQNNNLEALYVMATHFVQNQYGGGGNGRGRSYEDSVLLLKQLNERVEDFHSPLRWAQQMYRQGDLVSALLGFLIAAEQGYESAQVNVAYILDDSPGYIDLLGSSYTGVSDWRATFPNGSESGLVYWTRASKQINTDAQVKMGDYYLKGIGTKADSEKAAACYGAASERGHSMASWNLGWMHENGIGLEKDYHLAKRYYDHALAASPEGYLPVKLSLLQLHLKAYWNTLTGGKIRGIMNESRPKLSIREHWDLFWKRWNEMEFKLWEEDLDVYDLGGGGGGGIIGNDDERGNGPSGGDTRPPNSITGVLLEWDDSDGDLYDIIIILGLFVVLTLIISFRQRVRRVRQQIQQVPHDRVPQQQNQQQNQHQEHNEQHNEGETNEEEIPLNAPLGVTSAHHAEGGEPELVNITEN